MSSVGWSNWDDVSLLTDRHILRTDNSAIARMSEGEAIANGTAKEYIFDIKAVGCYYNIKRCYR